MRPFGIKLLPTALALCIAMTLTAYARAGNPGAVNDDKNTSPKSSTSTGKTSTHAPKTGSSKTHADEKTPSRSKYDSITLDRGVTQDPKMKNWAGGSSTGGSKGTGSTGSSTKSKTEVNSLNMGKQAPYDANSGQASGKRQHSPATAGSSSGSSTSKTNFHPTTSKPKVEQPVHKLNETPPATKTPATDHKQ